MTNDLIMKCLIFFILGYLSGRMMGNGFSVGGESEIEYMKPPDINISFKNLVQCDSTTPTQISPSEFCLSYDASIGQYINGSNITAIPHERPDGYLINKKIIKDQVETLNQVSDIIWPKKIIKRLN